MKLGDDHDTKKNIFIDIIDHGHQQQYNLNP